MNAERTQMNAGMAIEIVNCGICVYLRSLCVYLRPPLWGRAAAVAPGLPEAHRI